MAFVASVYDDGRHYDLLRSGAGDFPFYDRLAKQHKGPVLELACGTGRLAIPLAQAGAEITGLDISPAMLREARDKSKRAGIAIDFIEADAREFSLGRRFQLIVIANSSLCHLLRREEIEACLGCVRRHLAPNGRFVVDVVTPSAAILTRDPLQPYPVREYEDPDGRGHIVVTEMNRYNPATQVNHVTGHFERSGAQDAWDVPIDLRMFYPQEIDALLTYNGFAIENKYGAFDERPYDAASPRQIVASGVA